MDIIEIRNCKTESTLRRHDTIEPESESESLFTHHAFVCLTYNKNKQEIFSFE